MALKTEYETLTVKQIPDDPYRYDLTSLYSGKVLLGSARYNDFDVWLFYPKGTASSFDADELRDIADFLDQLNKEKS